VALDKLVNEHGVELRALPADVLARLRDASKAVVADVAKENELAARIHTSYMAFLERVRAYDAIAEQAYLNAR
jgi:TRAP-type mannitol/chloroaromatic compound transport system substrate-binding protein